MGKPSHSPRSVWLRRLAMLAIYVAIVVLTLRSIDRDQFLAVFERLEPAHIAAVLALIAFHFFGRALRYHALLLSADPKDYVLADGLRIFALGLSASAITPGRAGDVVKAELTRVHGIRRATGLGVVGIERMLDLAATTGTMAVTGAVIAHQFAFSGLTFGAIAVLASIVVGVTVVTARDFRIALIHRVTSRLDGWSERVRRLRLEHVADGFFAIWDRALGSRRNAIKYLAVTVVVWIADFSKLYVLLRCIGVDVDWVSVLFVYPASLIAGIISLLPFAEGIVGVAAVVLLQRVASVDLATATAAVVVDRGLSMLAPLTVHFLLSTLRARSA